MLEFWKTFSKPLSKIDTLVFSCQILKRKMNENNVKYSKPSVIYLYFYVKFLKLSKIKVLE